MKCFFPGSDSFANANKAAMALVKRGEIESNVETDYSRPRVTKGRPPKRFRSDSEDTDGSATPESPDRKMKLKAGKCHTYKEKKNKIIEKEQNEKEVRAQVAALL